jgi:hypothetical protein
VGHDPPQERAGPVGVEGAGADQHGIGGCDKVRQLLGGAGIERSAGDLGQSEDTSFGNRHGQPGCRPGGGTDLELPGPDPEGGDPGQERCSGGFGRAADDQCHAPVVLAVGATVVGQRPAAQYGRGDDDVTRGRRRHHALS